MKILPYLILIALLAILVITVIYLSRRFAWMFETGSTWPLYIGFSLLPAYFLTAGILFLNSTTPGGHLLYKISAVLMGIYLFLVISFLLVDLVNLYLKLKPSAFAIAALGLTALVSLGSYINAAYIRTSEVEVPIKGLTQSIKAAHLSDIHIGHFRTNGFLQNMVDKTNAAQPDVIFITGDYLDSHYALNEKYFEPLKQLKAPIYFVDGNHDHATNNDSILSLMSAAGVNVLYNDMAEFKDIQIVGLTHMLPDRKSFDMHANGHSPTMAETLPKLNIDAEKPSVLLHHAPSGAKYAHKAGIDLYLAGHTHAGQLFPFTFMARLIFDYNRGLNHYEDTKIFVSEGVGTFGPPFRLGTKSEIVILDLVPEK